MLVRELALLLPLGVYTSFSEKLVSHLRLSLDTYKTDVGE